MIWQTLQGLRIPTDFTNRGAAPSTSLGTHAGDAGSRVAKRIPQPLLSNPLRPPAKPMNSCGRVTTSELRKHSIFT